MSELVNISPIHNGAKPYASGFREQFRFGGRI